MAHLKLDPFLSLAFCFLSIATVVLSSVELSCTFSRCSLSNPCVSGTCNNGYCCGTTGSKHRAERSSRINATSKRAVPPIYSDDWSESNSYGGGNNAVSGMNGGGMMSMDSIKPIDPQLCTGGFSSPIKCAYYGGCPPGLVCDYKTSTCCPMLMALNEAKQHHTTSRRNYHHHPARYHQFSNYNSNNGNYLNTNSNGNNYFHRMQMMQRYPNYMTDNDMSQMRPRTRMSSYPCSNCEESQPYYSMSPMSSLGSANSISSSLGGSMGGCPDGGTGGGSCGTNGQCGSGYSCSRNNLCCERVVPATVCPDGTQAAGGCVNGQCGFGFMCNQGLCCTNSSQTPRCLDGSQAIGACMQGRCGENYLCTTGNICCPATLSMCPVGTTAIGPCVNGVCPVGYACINNQCCGPPSAANSSSLLTTCSQIDSNGPCLADNTCPDPGFNCDITNGWCCPNIAGDPVGPCIRGEGGVRLCPDGYACSGPEGGQCYRLETGTCAPQDQFGPCNPTEPKCPPGYTCQGGFCCADNATTYRRRKRSMLLAA